MGPLFCFFGELQPEAGTGRIWLRAEGGLDPGVELFQQRPLREPLRSKRRIRPAKSGGKAQLPGAGGRLPVRARVREAGGAGANQEIGGEVQEGAEEELGRPDPRGGPARGALAVTRGLGAIHSVMEGYGMGGQREGLGQGGNALLVARQ